MREEFEAAYVEGLVLRCGEGFRDTALYSLSEKKPSGDYQHYTDGIAWWAWQASRESLVIDLSDLSQCFSPNDCGDWAMWLDDVRIMVQAAGLKVKL